MITKVEDTKKYFGPDRGVDQASVGCAGDGARRFSSLDDGQCTFRSMVTRQLRSADPAGEAIELPDRADDQADLGQDSSVPTTSCTITWPRSTIRRSSRPMSARTICARGDRAPCAQAENRRAAGSVRSRSDVAALLPVGAAGGGLGAAGRHQPAGCRCFIDLGSPAPRRQRSIFRSPPIGLALKFSSAGVHGEMVVPGADAGSDRAVRGGPAKAQIGA